MHFCRCHEFFRGNTKDCTADPKYVILFHSFSAFLRLLWTVWNTFGLVSTVWNCTGLIVYLLVYLTFPFDEFFRKKDIKLNFKMSKTLNQSLQKIKVQNDINQKFQMSFLFVCLLRLRLWSSFYMNGHWRAPSHPPGCPGRRVRNINLKIYVTPKEIRSNLSFLGNLT